MYLTTKKNELSKTYFYMLIKSSTKNVINKNITKCKKYLTYCNITGTIQIMKGREV